MEFCLPFPEEISWDKKTEVDKQIVMVLGDMSLWIFHFLFASKQNMVKILGGHHLYRFNKIIN